MLIDAISFEESAATLTLVEEHTEGTGAGALTMLDRAKETVDQTPPNLSYVL